MGKIATSENDHIKGGNGKIKNFDQEESTKGGVGEEVYGKEEG